MTETQTGGPAAPVIRNLIAWRKQWHILVGGFFEPIFYLLGMGLGLGRIVGDIDLDGTPVRYAVFAAAGLMASSAMQGVLLATTFNFFFKLKFSRTFDSMLYSPLQMGDVLTGEVLWAVARAGLQSTVFLVVALGFGTVASWWAVLSVPACLLIALAFASLGTWVTTYVKAWTDFDLLNLGIMPMFLLSTTFFPLSVYPGWAHPLVQATPLYNGVALVRDLHTGLVGWHDVGHVIYLLGLSGVCAWLTTRRMRQRFLA